MASHGKVADLLDERYLNLQDVFGNVQPFPTLVQYEQYVQSIIVYRLNTNHEFYVPLLQDFTDRFARSAASAGREAWTWFVQWDVEQPSPDLAAPPAAKRQRRDALLDSAPKDTPAQPEKPYYGHIAPRLLHQELYLEENIQRILVDIVQVDSKFVPNYVEFLYQWIDYYEGSGRALKAALRQEIPSLWLFEFHPLPLFSTNEDAGDDGLDKAAEEMGERLIKPKEPLSLAEMELLTEQSERLQYREVKFGIHRPIVGEEPLPPLINVPQEHEKREQYYAACFNNRQRALFLLQEAGMTPKQIASYKKLQPMSPLETPEDINGDGFLNYYKEEPSAHAIFMENKHIRNVREKQREVAISNRLAEEARLAAHAVEGKGAPSPAVTVPGLAGSTHDKAPVTLKAENESRAPKQQDPGIRRATVKPKYPEKDPPEEVIMEFDSDDISDDSSDEEEYSNPDDIDPDERDEAVTPGHGLPTQRPLIMMPSAQPIQLIMNGDPYIARFVHHLNPTQVTDLLPRLNPQTQDAIGNARSDLTVPNPAPHLLSSNPNVGPNPYIQQVRQQPSMHAQLQMQTGIYQQTLLGNHGLVTAAPSALQFPSFSGSRSVFPSTGPTWPNTHATRDPSTSTYNSGNGVPLVSRPLFPSHWSMNGSAPTLHSFQNSPTLRSVSTGNASAPVPGGWPPVGMMQGITQHYSSNVPSELQARLQERANMPPIGYPQGQTVALTNASLPITNRHDRPIVHGPQVLRQATNNLNPPSMLPPRNVGQVYTPHIPNEYTAAANMPAAVSFAEILQTTNRAPRPPNLDLHRASINHPPHNSMNFNRGSPIAMTPLQQQAEALSLASPIAFRDNPVHSASPHGVPIQIYVPKVVIPHKGTFDTATDCLILGYTKPETGILELSKAIFLPTGIWENVLRRVHRGNAQVLETYAPPPNHPRFMANKGILRNPGDIKGPHKFVHLKLTQIFSLMTSCANREQELTKRWRITPGPMTAKARGAIWEGWGLFVDRPIELGYEERHGVGSIVSRSMDGKRGFGLSENEWKEKERRMRELDEMLEEEGEESDEDRMQE